ncbi:MAG: hypothetical protein E6J90_52375 [Deltaproteobacteria bacterium]|nr:MAG: hypothetical protein E6J90_52375 [Deltaproteobacteria bacterium]
MGGVEATHERAIARQGGAETRDPVSRRQPARHRPPGTRPRGTLDAACDRQLARLRPWNLRCNAEMPSTVERATCKLDSLGERTLADLVEKRRSFTARSIDRLIKVARTIADLLGQDDIDAGCLLEAAVYRDVDATADLVPHVM